VQEEGGKPAKDTCKINIDKESLPEVQLQACLWPEVKGLCPFQNAWSEI